MNLYNYCILNFVHCNSQVREKCIHCGDEVAMADLRQHVQHCSFERYNYLAQCKDSQNGIVRMCCVYRKFFFSGCC